MRAPSRDTATATVERRDLVDRDTVQGTLGYADSYALLAGATGTITRLRDPGAVVRRGQSLYDIDDARGGVAVLRRRCPRGATSARA